jgi:hypothetical protein
MTTEDRVELHDKLLRGSGEGKLGIVALCVQLTESVDKLSKTVHDLELTVAKAKGWILGAAAVGSTSGALITFVIEHFVVRK